MDTISEFKTPVWDPCQSIPEFPELADTSIEDLIKEIVLESFSIAERLGVEKDRLSISDSEVYGWEVGDDRLDISNNPFPLLMSLAAQEKVMRFETSWKDTGISTRLWNFCEVTSNVPSTTLGDIRRAKKNGFADLDYVDVPPLRIVIDVSKARAEDSDHSSSITGKSEMLGNRIKSCRTNIRSLLEVSSFLQDGILATCGSPDPKYLPGIMGGCSCPPLFGAWENTYSYLINYKNGTYRRVYGSAINELYNCVRDLDNQKASQPAISSFLRKRQELLHITYGANVVIPEIPTLNEGEEVRPLYKAVGGSPFLQGVENRLVQTRLFATKRMAERELEIRNGIRILLLNDNSVGVQRSLRKLEKKRLSEEFDGTIRANSAYQRMLANEANDSDLTKLYLDGNLIAGSGRTDLNRYGVEWIAKGGNGEIFNIHDLTHSEDMYVFEEVSETRSLRVSGIQLTPQFNRKPIITKETRSEIGLWQITDTKMSWAQKILDQLIQLREERGILHFQDVYPIMVKNTEWVSDDTLIVRRMIEDVKNVPKQTVLLLSADKRLAMNAARTTGFPVAMVDPQSFIVNNGNELELSAEIEVTPNQLLGTDAETKNLLVGHHPVFDVVYVDSGSLESYAQRFTTRSQSGVGRENSLLYRRLLHTGVTPEGKRYETQSMTEVKNWLVPKVKVCYPNETVFQSATVVRQSDLESGTDTGLRSVRGLRRFLRR